MQQSYRISFLLFMLFGAGMFFSQIWLEEVRLSQLERKIYLPPPGQIEHISFGYNEVLADVLWLRLIQDIDVCGKALVERNSVVGLRGQLEGRHGVVDQDVSDDVFVTSKKKICNKGWVFQLLDAITSLSPKFRMPYAIGAATLSVLVEDHMGAKVIFDKGVKNFPNDWPILYRAAYHYLYEIRDLETAARLLNQAAENGAPMWVKSLASRLYTRTGQLVLGIQTLKSYLTVVTNPAQRKEVEARIEALREAMVKSGAPENIE